VHFTVAWRVLHTEVTDVWSVSTVRSLLRYIYCSSRDIRLSQAYSKIDRPGGLENIYQQF